MRRWPRSSPGRPPAKSSSERCPPRPCRTSVSTPDQLISRKGPVGHQSETLYQPRWTAPSPGKGSSMMPLHCWQRLFDQPLPGSYEPILRAGLGVASNYPDNFGHEVHLSPLLTRVHTMLPNLAAQRLPVLPRRPRMPHGGTPLSRQTPTGKLGAGQPLGLYPGQVPRSPAGAVSDLSIT